ncbi:MAG: YdcF family protein [Saprospiraceae bacterium]|nr:YdcF family protein [Saprospiraceae bacterium]
MFFILSKLLAFLLKPLNWLVMLAVMGLWVKKRALKRRIILALSIGLLFFTNPWLVNQMARVWETGKRSPADIVEPYDIGILLGGFVNFNAEAPPGLLTFHQAGNRLTTTLLLYETGKIRRILITGGAGRLIGKVPEEATATRKFLIQCGVPDSVILVENNARNTRENALFSKNLIDSLAPESRCLLITSAWHIRRAEMSFRQAGLPCDVFAADFLSESSRGNWLDQIEPDWKALLKWELLIKEWVGSLAYRL